MSNYLLIAGPDTVLPASCVYTSKRDEAVKLRMSDTGPLAVKPISIPTMFQETVRKHPQGLALAHKRKGEWVKWTYKQYYDDVIKAAKSFIKVCPVLESLFEEKKSVRGVLFQWFKVTFSATELSCDPITFLVGNCSFFLSLQLGLERYHAVGIIGFNSPEWFIADLGAIFAG